MISLVLLGALGPAWAGEPAKKEEARIPFINLSSSILSWQADGEQGLWIQDQRKQWYDATTYGRCEGLAFTAELGFKLGTLNTLDRFSDIIVPNYGTCGIRSLVKSEEPPSGKRHATGEDT
jgi:hypothetical protein